MTKVELAGLEPATPCLPGKYSSQLSYSPRLSVSPDRHTAPQVLARIAPCQLMPEGCLDL